ncbi:hypothetical protein [Dactylosporangium siamense]|uniref:Ankyrin repeat domain-containing protein n=1 Tax=Dactylosporangium siamense TaxID=685454 RepID=A0A919PX86_9ACTN|nr:hypothetical protein [Dactylosporangium siamense]GIG51347.1 hypothetical protein Dsi01nite_093880 [Dactylosporangium siamense]
MSWRRELAAARWTRRLGVPAWMITAATARRLAGDWRGACAAAHVDVELDPSAIAHGDGGAVAERVEDDLRHLVPDLLRWHLDPAQPVTLLNVYGGTRALFVLRRAPERLALRYGAVPPDSWRGSLVHSRERWDSRHTGALTGRLFLDAGGSRLPREAWGLAEHVIAMQDAGDWIGAWRLAGFDLEALVGRRPELRGPGAPAARRVWRLNLTGLRAAIRSAGAPSEGVLLDHVDGAYTTQVRDTTVSGVAGEDGAGAALRLPAALVERPVDADLVRLGMLPASALHPLVGAALFPALSTMPPAPEPGVGPVRVRRDGVWRFAEPGDLGWHDPLAALPKVLRLRRDTVVRLARHGDAPALLAWLAAGGDPYFRDPERRTMLHLLAHLPGGGDTAELVETLLLELLAAGLDLEARDRAGLTPLLFAVANGGAATTVRALVTMGADVSAVTFAGAGWADLARAAGCLEDLWFLLES